MTAEEVRAISTALIFREGVGVVGFVEKLASVIRRKVLAWKVSKAQPVQLIVFSGLLEVFAGD